MKGDDAWDDRDTAALLLALIHGRDEPAGRLIRDKLERRVLTREQARSFIHAFESNVNESLDSRAPSKSARRTRARSKLTGAN